MKGLMMDFQLTIPVIMRRAESLFGKKEIVTRLPDKSIHRYTYSDFVKRAKKLSVALRSLGVKPGDRVGTLCWNHYQHLEAYFGIPIIGAVLHTLNLRLGPEDLAYIVNHGDDKVIIVDDVLLPLFEKFKTGIKAEHIIVVHQHGKDVPVGMLSYEALLATADEKEFEYLDFDEHTAAALCYTTGTTGLPKGVLYTHRSVTLHSLVFCFAGSVGIQENDTVLPVVPMFHANAWGLPYACTLLGAKQVFPGPFLDPISLLELYESEQVTVTGGVPTVWFGILQALDKEPNKFKLNKLRALLVGGSAAPKAMIKGFQDRHHLNVVHAWGMTELSPVGTLGQLTTEMLALPLDQQYDCRAKQGIPSPFVEFRGRSEEGLIPWDGNTMGELEVRGPWVASSYYNTAEMADRFTSDGWFCTGDIVTIDSRGAIQIQDRTKDVVKSGGEWISSVALENAIMSHPAVLEAAVIAVTHPKWQERPLAIVVLKEGETATAEDIINFLKPQFDKMWIPDGVEFVKAIPRTAVGKFLKSALRDQFREWTKAD